ncbi:hypothetical protein PBI_MRMAGOO_116 [Mycobacterium phage MrMagoo]|uniref:Uncharacterized protein n=1 Tax=Mycobacterium phage MrMagoo TaxID=1927020 RepID=A0A1L6BYP2_9CAUD|nr:hypothetical protein J4U04_gp153 [Mycobacterium phage MrMagoo]APQ42209.1 hypothetical protein PBI_MRMAGOO_116 [Mycobacterium phage MrMagoo]
MKAEILAVDEHDGQEIYTYVIYSTALCVEMTEWISSGLQS